MDSFDFLAGLISKKEFWGPILTILVGFLAYQLVKQIPKKIFLSGKNALKNKKRTTAAILFENVLRYVFIVIVVLTILQIFGVDTRAIIAGLGIAGLIIALALQDTIRDLIAGLTIIMDNYFVVGDIIEFRGTKGEVISIGLRSSKIQKFTGEIQTFANRNIDVVINHSHKQGQIVFEVITPYEENLEKMEKIFQGLNSKIEELQNVERNKTEYAGIREIIAAGVKHTYIVRCKKSRHYDVKRECIKIMKKEFDKKKIKVLIS